LERAILRIVEKSYVSYHSANGSGPMRGDAGSNLLPALFSNGMTTVFVF